MRIFVGLEAGNAGRSDYEEVVVIKQVDVQELLFRATCCECNKMSAIPQGAFAVLKVHKNFERYHRDEEEKTGNNKDTGFGIKNLEEGREPTPLKYNSKLMNSIWGLYNRYSVHNFKKIDANEGHLFGEALGASVPQVGSVIGTCTGAGQ